MNIEAKVILDSVSHKGVRLTTFQLKYHRFIHSELMTHRVFSRNASSSRAIPVMKVLRQVWSDPAIPIHWGQNQPGMQANAQLDGWKKTAARTLWKLAGKVACVFAYAMVKVGLHKQVANRILEPWQFIHVVLSATTFDNWFALRDHSDAQPEIRELAQKMRKALNGSHPARLKPGQWHLPYLTFSERAVLSTGTARKVSAARCCRVSYLKHDGKESDIFEDEKLCDRLTKSKPIHASPFEHVASPLDNSNLRSGNFQGWMQYRELVEGIVK